MRIQLFPENWKWRRPSLQTKCLIEIKGDRRTSVSKESVAGTGRLVLTQHSQ
jgi:hypothetical protein